MEYATSFRQLAVATGYGVSSLHEKARKGQIPERGPQGYCVADVLAAIAANTDPGRRKPMPESRSVGRSAERSAPNAPNGSNAHHIAASGPIPDPADYRARPDLSSFEAGALYALHALAYDLPCFAACTVQEHGADLATALAVYREVAQDAGFTISDVCVRLGLIPDGEDHAGRFAPRVFGGFNYWPGQSAG